MKPKLTPEAIKRAAELRQAGESMSSIRETILEEFGINVARATLQEATDKYAEGQQREQAVQRVAVEEARLSADAARTVATAMAAEDLPADAKLIQLRLASLVGRSNASWEGMSAREKCSFRTWAKLEDLTLRTLILKLKLGGALQPGDDLEAVDKALTAKLESLAKKTPKA